MSWTRASIGSVVASATLVAALGVAAEPTEPAVVATEPVTASGGTTQLSFSGVTRAERRADLSFSVAGRVVELRASAGQGVRKGERLARVESTELESAVREADAVLNDAKVQWRQARREKERTEQLLEVGAHTRRDLDQARAAEEATLARVAAARSRLQEAKQRLDRAALRAPFAGTVSEVRVREGEYAAAGVVVLRLSGDGPLEVEVWVPGSVVHRIGRDAPAHVEFPLAALPAVDARVRSVTSAAAGERNLFPVLVSLPAIEGLLAGMAARVVLSALDDDGLLVPLAAVVDPTGAEPVVFRLEAGHVQRLPVEVLGMRGDRVKVRGALRDGDRVVVAGHASLLDGDPVEALPAAHVPQ